MSYPIPANEHERLGELARFRALEWGRSAALDGLCAIASKQLNVPIALVSLVGATEQYFPAKIGISVDRASREVAFCAHAIINSEPLIIENAANDERFANNPLVKGEPGIAAYAGIPLETTIGVRLGTFCAVDLQPRKFTPDDVALLSELSRLAIFTMKAHLNKLLLDDEMRRAVAAMQAKLTESELRFDICVRGSSVGLWDWNVETNALYWSDRFKDMIGIADDAFVPELSSFEDRLHPDDHDRIMASLARYLQTGERYDVEYRLRRETGDYLWIHARAQAVWDETGKPIRMAGSAEDISARKSAEFELLRRTAELERINRELDQFGAVLAHDLKAPIRRVRTFLPQVLEAIEAGKTDEALADYNRVLKNIVHMDALIDALSQYCKTQNVVVPHNDHCAQALVEETLSLLQPAIEEQRATVTYANLPEVKGNKPQLIQLLQNLIGNSLKYCDKAVPIITIEAAEAGDFWEFTIADNGIGIESAFLDKVFEPFLRLHNNSQYSGVGLGLATCKTIIERHNGAIWCDSEVGKGTKFHFTLPRASGKDSAKTAR